MPEQRSALRHQSEPYTPMLDEQGAVVGEEPFRPPIERLMDGIEWHELPAADGDDLHATHEGVLQIEELRLRCYILSDGRRIFDADDVARVFAEAGDA